MKKNKLLLFIGVILLLGFFLRFYKLDSIPNGLQQDETSIGYNAYSILKTGKDEFGQKYPLYFKAFGEYKLPVAIYLTVPSIKIFGLNVFAIRFPFALLGSLTILLVFLLVKEWDYKNKALPIISAFLLAINPWHLHFSRGSFEVTPALFFITLGVLLFIKFSKNKNIFIAILSIISFILSIYTYNVARLFVPIVFSLLVFIYRKELAETSKKRIVIFVTVGIICLAPFILNLFSGGGVENTKGTLILTSAVTQSKLLELRNYMGMESLLWAKLFFNKWDLTIFEYFKNIAEYLNVDFFFISGSLHGNHGVGNVGQFYLFELITVIAGVVIAIKNKSKFILSLFCWIVSIILVASLTREAPYATRSFFLIVPVEILSAVGLVYLYTLIKDIKRKKIQILIFLIALVFCFYNTVYYFSSYYIRFPILYAKSWRSEDKSVSIYIQQNEKRYKKIIFDKNAGFIYTSLLFYAKYNPEQFQSTVLRFPDDDEGFSIVKSFGKYEFRDIDWSSDTKSPDTLIITTTDRKPNEVPPLITFFYPKRPVAFAVKQQVVSYPIEEPAYVLIKTN